MVSEGLGNWNLEEYKEQQKRTPKKCPACKSGDVTMKVYYAPINNENIPIAEGATNG